MKYLLWLLPAIILAVVGCSDKRTMEPGIAVHGESAKPNAFLAYEHTVLIAYADDIVAARMAIVRDACVEERFGACSVLLFNVTAGERAHGALSVRAAPEAVEPLVALAGEGGRIGSRETRAEDLARAVADTSEQRQRLELNHGRLLEFQARSDLSVGDMLTIARELASVEAQLQQLARTAAEQQRRIESNLLTMRFSVDSRTSRIGRIGDAFDGVLDSAADGVAEAVEWLAFGLPLLLVAFPVALLWRLLWWRFTRGRRPEP
ncbi:MAG TPA: DUF4349 domain-containing protein [Xanthomonadaceae bacterium]|nr:DUF4349 domain-containing protein [Xanthomonadaceae bacterium]